MSATKRILTRDDHLADDVVQTLFRKLLDQLGYDIVIEEVRGPGTFSESFKLVERPNSVAQKIRDQVLVTDERNGKE